MTQLEHVNLVTRDFAATLEFLQTAFPEWLVRGQGESEWYGVKRRWLHFGTQECYVTLNEGNTEPNRDLAGHAPGLAHIGFVVEDVDAINERLQRKGYELEIIGADHPYRKNVYFLDPSGFEFEFIQYLSEVPALRNMYGGETSEFTRVSAGSHKQ
ncbi:MAG: VOC family protein [Gemmatimonadota bacterium]|nr:VOC family protein [Gemmatimonadota bacterium]